MKAFLLAFLLTVAASAQTIVFQTVPPGARVILGSTEVGQSGRSLRLQAEWVRPKTVELSFRLPGYRPWTQRVASASLRARPRWPEHGAVVLAREVAPTLHVTFHSYPEGASILAYDSARQPAYLGRTGQPVSLDGAWLSRGSSLEVIFRLPGYQDWSETIPTGLLRDGSSWPPPGKALRLAPASGLVAARDFLWSYPAVPAMALGLLALGWRRRRPLGAEPAASAPELTGDETERLLALGGYTMIRELGRGGMSRVYEVVRQSTGEICALKLLNQDLYRDAEAILRLRREIKIWRELVHPGIVALLDFGEVQGRYYLVMEKVDGCDLRGRLKAGRIRLEEGLRFLDRLLDTVEFAHERGVVHRDLKPENIMLRDDGRLQVLDFGISKNVNSATVITVGDSVLGTPAYMAPERFAGLGDQATDQYALGLIFYEILAGQHPFGESTDVARLIHMQLSATPEPIRSHRPGVPEEVEAVVMKMLEKEPARRYPNLREARRALHWAVGPGPLVGSA